MAVIKTSSWFTKLPPDHVRIGISRGTPTAQRAPFVTYRRLQLDPWFKTCATPQEYVRLYYREVLSKLDPKAVVGALDAIADGGIPTLLCCEAPPPNPAWCHRALVSAWLFDELGLEVCEFGPRASRLRLAAPEDASVADVSGQAYRREEVTHFGRIHNVHDPIVPDAALQLCQEPGRVHRRLASCIGMTLAGSAATIPQSRSAHS
jgi:hypothetical protein